MKKVTLITGASSGMIKDEALHISDEEKVSLEETIHKIEQEYQQKLDRHSQELIVFNIKLLQDYIRRYFDRQF